jgi:hypothetical protein
MTSKEKVQRFLDVTGIKGMYSSVIEYSLTYFIAKAESEGDPLADGLKKIKGGFRQELEDVGVEDVAAEVIAGVFSDDELDELIVLHSTPALNRLHGLAPEIMGRILEGMSK